MPNSLVLLHFRKEKTLEKSDLDPCWFQWETCLRRVILGSRSWLSLEIAAGAEVMEGPAAYQFLLELVCGLHSPILGETEVLGQFREAVEKYLINSEHNWKYNFSELSQALFRDVKMVRSRYLRGLGAQSYGSFARKAIAGREQIHLVGSGHLALEILPWIYDGRKSIHVYCRNLNKARALQEKFPKLELKIMENLADISATSEKTALLLAAPCETQWILRHAPLLQQKSNLVIDFREESRFDPLHVSCASISLAQVFAALAATSENIQQKVALAKSAIAERAQFANERIEHKPFGWEDVCA